MKIDVSSLNSYQRKLSITIPADKVRQEVDQAYRRLGRGAKIRGFRPGKVPRKVLEARFGPQIQSEVAESLIQTSWGKAISDHDIEPVSQPNLDDVGEIKASDPFSFTILVDVKPAVEVDGYEGVEVYFPKAEVSDEEVDQAIRHRLEGHAKLVEVEGRPVQAGDFVLAEVKAVDGDEEVAHEPGTMIRTEADPYYPGVEALLIGLEKDGEKTDTVDFPETARAEAVAGRSLSVTVKVVGIQANEVPELSEEIAEELGFEGGAVGMRAALQSELVESRNELARNQARANMLQELISANTFDVPGSMVESNLKLLMDELRMQQMLRGADPKNISFSDPQVADLRQRAAFATKAGLILEFVTTKEGIEVTEADVDAKLQELADSRGQTIEAVRGYFQKEDAVSELKERLIEEKTLDWLLERAKLVDEPPVKAEAEAEAAPAEAAAEE
jgi:trigger factor